jgi:hypothetical protein
MEPQYVTLNGPQFVFRPPARSQKQGMSHENLRMKAPGQTHYNQPDVSRLIKFFNSPSIRWTPDYSRLMSVEGALPSLRLSKDIAFYHDRGVKAEYKGRFLGFVHDDNIYIDCNDAKRPWIVEAVQNIGCSAKPKEA